MTVQINILHKHPRARPKETLAALGLAVAFMGGLLLLAGTVVMWDASRFKSSAEKLYECRLDDDKVKSEAIYAREKAREIEKEIIGNKKERLFTDQSLLPSGSPLALDMLIDSIEPAPHKVTPEKMPDSTKAVDLAKRLRRDDMKIISQSLPVLALTRVDAPSRKAPENLENLYEKGQLGVATLGRPGENSISPSPPEMPSMPNANGFAPPPPATTDFKVPERAGDMTRKLVQERPGKGYPNLDGDIVANFSVYRKPGEDEAFFRLDLSLKPESNVQDIDKDVLFLIDISQSISPSELKRVRKAVTEYLVNLRKGDRWNIVLFSENQFYMHEEIFVSADKVDEQAVRKFIDHRRDERRTDVFHAVQIILGKLPASDRPCNVFLISDGKATHGTSEVRQIVHDFQRVNRDIFSVFTYNAGPGGDIYLLSLLSYRSRGVLGNCPEKDSITEDLKRFMNEVDRPVLTNVIASYTNLKTSDVCPAVLPNLYRNRAVTFWGKTYPGKNVALRVAGMGEGGPREFFFEAVVPEGDESDPEIARGWARGQAHEFIARLGDNPEDETLRNRIVELAKKYSLADIQEMIEKKSWKSLLPWRK